MKIAGLILAAGASRRLGRPKQLLPLGGRPLAAWSLATMRAFGPDQIVLVLGHEAAAVAAALDLRDVSVVVNEHYGDGQSTSLRCGLSAVDPRMQAALFITCDQPLISADLLRRLTERYDERGEAIVATDYGDHLGVPLLLDRAVWPLASAIQGDQGARALLRAHPERVGRVVEGDPTAALDVDTEEQYLEVRRLVEQHPRHAAQPD